MTGRKTAVRLVVSLALLVTLGLVTDISAILHGLTRISLRALVPVLALMAAAYFLAAWKWRLLLRATGIHARFTQVLRLFWVGSFYNNFLPGRTGGDIIRAISAGRGSVSGEAAAASVLVDRGFSLLSLPLIGCIAYAWSPSPDARPVVVFLLAILGAVAGARFLTRRHFGSSTRIARFMSAASTALTDRTLASSALFLSVAYQTVVILANIGVARALGVDVPVGAFFYLIPAVSLASAVPISINGFGVREASYAIAFAHVGVPADTAIAMSLASVSIAVAVSLIGGLFTLVPVRLSPVPNCLCVEAEISDPVS